MVANGLQLPPHMLALVCASHDGREEHLRTATEILATAGLTPNDLGNTADYPLDPEAHDASLRAGNTKTALQMNCSGKHSGMLATCVHNDWDRSTYLHVDHPLQQRITDMVPELSGEDASYIGRKHIWPLKSRLARKARLLPSLTTTESVISSGGGL